VGAGAPTASELDQTTDFGLPDPPPAALAGRSIWPAIYPELLRLVQEHRSTIIFVNSRRGSERLAVRLNELAGEDPGGPDAKPAEIARAHHGSLAREERTW
jgi:ATP-dependent Lhr-like helicase